VHVIVISAHVTAIIALATPTCVLVMHNVVVIVMCVLVKAIIVVVVVVRVVVVRAIKIY
jgi:hypothetical protein